MAASSMTTAILAGGAGTRLGGRDKGLELLDGRALVDRAVAAARAMDPAAPVLICANRHHDFYALRGPVVADSERGFHGPLAGVATALAACATPWLLTLPVDCPCPPDDLAARCSAALRADATLAAAVAHDGERRQPLFALYRVALARGAAEAVAAGQGVAQWQDSLGLREVDFSAERRRFRNLNTPADFTRHGDELAS